MPRIRVTTQFDAALSAQIERLEVIAEPTQRPRDVRRGDSARVIA